MKGVGVRILGTLELDREGVPLDLPAPKQCAVLCVLLLHRGEVVSGEDLIDELWGETPPLTASKSLHVHVSRLRKTLGADVLETRGHGYVLDVDPAQVDATQFESLLDTGREQLSDGDADGAGATLRRALDLWRGPALADFASEAFAQAEIRRLEALHVAALEERIEADIRLGRHAELVPELEALVAQHPLRERLRGQLMLTLYRTGRQAEALACYRQARERLVEDLGLEPGPTLRDLERAILIQDPQLEPPPAQSGPGRRRRSRRRMVALAAATVLVVAAAWLIVDRTGHRPVSVRANSVVAIDPTTNEVVGDVSVGGAPSSIAIGEGAVWVLNADDHTISRIDPTPLAVAKTFAINAEPSDLAVGDGAVWVSSGVAVTSGEFFTALDPVGVSSIDPELDEVTRQVALPDAGRDSVVRRGVGQRRIAIGGGAAWVADVDGALWRVDDASGSTAVAAGGGLTARALDYGRDGLWVVTDTSLVRVDASGHRTAVSVDIPTISLGSAASTADAVWLTDPIAGALWRVDPTGRTRPHAIAVGAGSWSVAAGEGGVWLANTLDSTVLRIDPTTARVVARIPLSATPRELAVGDGRVWVTVGAESAAPAGGDLAAGPVDGALPSSSCGPVSYGGSGSPDVVVASDLPLQTGLRGVTFPMSQAIEYVLARHDFRAGRFTVGYQSCDDSTVQAGGSDAAKCTANARLYAATPKVLAVIGPYDSSCASMEIPILNSARDGPVALVSPANSAPGLTRAIPGSSPAETDAFYPTGARNYARVSTRDDFQGAADAVLAHDLGLRRVFVLKDDAAGAWADVIAGSFVRAAGRLDVDIAGSARWKPGTTGDGSIVSQVVDARPDGVFLAGLVVDGAGPLVEGLRTALGPDVALVAADGFAAISFLRDVAGKAAQGMYVSVLGAPDSQLTSTGREFVREFAATQPGVVPSYSATYAAQATEVVLGAIARSDGTRASVTEELFRTDVKDGILGTFRLDGFGDPTSQPVTILEVGADPTTNPTGLTDHQGSVIDRVITPPSDLVQ